MKINWYLDVHSKVWQTSINQSEENYFFGSSQRLCYGFKVGRWVRKPGSYFFLRESMVINKVVGYSTGVVLLYRGGKGCNCCDESDREDGGRENKEE